MNEYMETQNWNGITVYLYNPQDIEFQNFKKDLEYYNSGEANKLKYLVSLLEENYRNIERDRYRGLYLIAKSRILHCQKLVLSDNQILLLLSLIERMKRFLLENLYGLNSFPA